MSNARALFAFTRVLSAELVTWIDLNPSRYPFHVREVGKLVNKILQRERKSLMVIAFSPTTPGLAQQCRW